MSSNNIKFNIYNNLLLYMFLLIFSISCGNSTNKEKNRNIENKKNNDSGKKIIKNKENKAGYIPPKKLILLKKQLENSLNTIKIKTERNIKRAENKNEINSIIRSASKKMDDITYKHQIKHDNSGYSRACGKMRDEAVEDIESFAKKQHKNFNKPIHKRDNITKWEHQLRKKLNDILDEAKEEIEKAHRKDIHKIVNKYQKEANDETFHFQKLRDHTDYSRFCGKFRDKINKQIQQFADEKHTHKSKHKHKPNISKWEHQLKTKLNDILDEAKDEIEKAHRKDIHRIINKYQKEANDETFHFQKLRDHTDYSRFCGEFRDKINKQIQEFADEKHTHKIKPRSEPNITKWEHQLKTKLNDILDEAKDEIEKAHRKDIHKIVNKYQKEANDETFHFQKLRDHTDYSRFCGEFRDKINKQIQEFADEKHTHKIKPRSEPNISKWEHQLRKKLNDILDEAKEEIEKAHRKDIHKIVNKYQKEANDETFHFQKLRDHTDYSRFCGNFRDKINKQIQEFADEEEGKQNNRHKHRRPLKRAYDYLKDNLDW